MSETLINDWKINKGNWKSLLVLSLFRLAHHAAGKKRPWIFLFYPYLVFYRVLVEWFLGVEIPFRLRIGPRVRLFHGQGLVINERTIIGSDCTLRHNTTIGSAYDRGKAPVIGNHVDIGCHVVILGDIHIGDHSVIAAGSVVIKDVPANAVVAGNPAKVIRIKEG